MSITPTHRQEDSLETQAYEQVERIAMGSGQPSPSDQWLAANTWMMAESMKKPTGVSEQDWEQALAQERSSEASRQKGMYDEPGHASAMDDVIRSQDAKIGGGDAAGLPPFAAGPVADARVKRGGKPQGDGS